MPPRREDENEATDDWTAYRMFVMETLREIRDRQLHIEQELQGMKIKVALIAFAASMIVPGVTIALKLIELRRY